MLELGKDLLDRIEVWAVGRQEEQVCACGPDGAAHGVSLVAAEIVENHDVAFGEGRHEDFLDIEGEEFAIDRPVDDPGRIDPVAAQGGDEGQGFPVAVWDRCSEALAARRPAPECRHIRLDPGFIEKDQPAGFDPLLVGLPAQPLAGNVRSRLLSRQNRFF